MCLRRPSADFLGSRGAFCRYKTVAINVLIGSPIRFHQGAALAEPTAITLHALRVADVDPTIESWSPEEVR